MKRMNRLAQAVTLGITAAVVLAPMASMAQQLGERRSVMGQEKRTPGTNGGVPGSWVEYTEYVYRYAPPVQKALDAYKEILGQDLTEGDLAGIRAKLDNGSLTIDQLKAQLTEAKGLLSFNPDLAKEWHSRDFDLNKLRSNFGNTGGWVDGLANNANKASTYQAFTGGVWNTANVEGYGGDGISILGQSSRLLRLSELMESGVLPSGKFEIQGLFTHYDTARFDTTTPYYAPVMGGLWGEDHGRGSFSDIMYYVRPGMTADEIQRAIYQWYGAAWGNALKIDIKNATAAQLREAAKLIYQSAASTGSPIALDLSGNKRIGVTGRSTAQARNAKHTFVADGAVKFDLFGIDKPIRIEWMSAENDALLVDDRKGEVTKAANTNGVISGKQLFGNAGGFDNGYIKLALILLEYNRLASTDKNIKFMTALRGQALDGLKAWVDSNHDAKVQPGELRTLESLGITEIEVFPKKVTNSAGETLIQSTYVEQGKRKLAEDVWFAIDPAEKI